MENKDFNKVLESVFGQEDQVIKPELLAIAMTEQMTYDVIHKGLFGVIPTIPTYALCSLYDKGAFGKEITLEKVIDSIFKLNEIDEKDAFFAKVAVIVCEVALCVRIHNDILQQSDGNEKLKKEYQSMLDHIGERVLKSDRVTQMLFMLMVEKYHKYLSGKE